MLLQKQLYYRKEVQRKKNIFVVLLQTTGIGVEKMSEHYYLTCSFDGAIIVHIPQSNTYKSCTAEITTIVIILNDDGSDDKGDDFDENDDCTLLQRSGTTNVSAQH